MNLHLVDGVTKTTKKGELSKFNEARIKGVAVAGVSMPKNVMEEYRRERELIDKIISGKHVEDNGRCRTIIIELVQDSISSDRWYSKHRISYCWERV